MKKLMIAAAIVCAAAFANAASVNWILGTINAPGTDGSGWSDDGLTGSVDVQLIIGSSLTNGEIGDTVYNGSTTVAFDSGYGFPDALTIDGMSSDTPYYSQLILTYGDSTLNSGIYEIQASSLAGDEIYPEWGFAGEEADLAPAGVGSLAGLSSFHGTYGTFGSSGWAGAPEPTSGLLLLVGGAMLALRRKRRA